MRLESSIVGCTLINDTYNSDVASLDIALDFLTRRPNCEGRSKTLILSDILQTGLPSHELYSKVADLIAQRGIDHLIGIGEEITQQQACFQTNEKHFFPTTKALLQSGLLDTLKGEMILIKEHVVC